MSKSLLELPDVIIREIFEYAIDAYTAENVKIYTNICMQIYKLFKVIIQDQVERFKRNPFLFKFYSKKLFPNIIDDRALAAVIPFNYGTSDKLLLLQIIEFMKSRLLSGDENGDFSVYSLGVFIRIITHGPKKFQNVTGLDYEKAIGPVVIEVYSKTKGYYQKIAALFFRKRQWIHLFMITGVIRWMKTKNIPDSSFERNRLLKMIYSLRHSMILDDYKGSVFFVAAIVMGIVSSKSTVQFFQFYGPYLFPAVLLSLFILTVVSHNMAFPVDINPLTESELEAKAKETDYLRLANSQ